jgi:hypothetical protein
MTRHTERIEELFWNKNAENKTWRRSETHQIHHSIMAHAATGWIKAERAALS